MRISVKTSFAALLKELIMIKISLFVDGSNLSGSLSKLNLNVDDYELFYKYIAQESIKTIENMVLSAIKPTILFHRVYWYELGSMDDWDLDLPSSKETIKDLFNNEKIAKNSYMSTAAKTNSSKDQSIIYEEAWELFYQDVKSWYSEKKNKLIKLKKFHFGISSETDFIRLIECGHWKVDFVHQSVEEKGLDTKLSVDLVTQINNYDIALLLSGDADIIPSIEFIRDSGKQIGTIEFIKGHPPEKKGRQSSSKLKSASDFVIQIFETELIKNKICATRTP